MKTAICVLALAGVAFTHGLAGLEFGVAIPASVGGAVRMNAGAHGREMAHVLESIDVFELLACAPRRIVATELALSYRGSQLARDAVVVGARTSLVAGDRVAIRARMDEARDWRRRTQPLAEPNCGSVFKNPPGDYAGRLIEAAGLKGHRVGGAQISPLHANFIANLGGATASDVMELIRLAKDRVRAHSGTPFNVTSAGTSLNAPGSDQRADQVKSDVQILGGIGRGNPYFDPFAFAPVTEARFGTAPWRVLRGPGVANWDLGVFREFALPRTMNVQLRVEAFNVLNKQHFDNPGGTVSNLRLNPDGTIRDLNGFAEILTATNERQMRVGVRLGW